MPLLLRLDRQAEWLRRWSRDLEVRVLVRPVGVVGALSGLLDETKPRSPALHGRVHVEGDHPGDPTAAENRCPG